jgi:hypothetical protein
MEPIITIIAISITDTFLAAFPIGFIFSSKPTIAKNTRTSTPLAMAFSKY